MSNITSIVSNTLCKVLEVADMIFLYNGAINTLTLIENINTIHHLTSNNFDSDKIDYSPKIQANIDIDNLMWKSKNMLQHVIINLTEKCNMRCEYCAYHDIRFQNNNPLRNIDKKVLEKTLDFIYIHSTHAHETAISFYGGEPLLELNLIDHAINYLERINSRGHNFKYFITTNAILLDSNVSDFLVKKNITCTISLDGPSSVHDRFRIDINGNATYQTVIKNIKCLAKRHPDYYKESVFFNAVVSPPFDHVNIYDFFSKSKVSYIDVVFGNYFNEYLRNKYGTSVFEKNSNTIPISSNIDNTYTEDKYLGYLKKFMNLVEVYDNKTIFPTGFCVPLERRISISTDGSINLCERIDDSDSLFNLGNIFTGYNYEKVLSLYKYTCEVLSGHCNKCWANRFCNTCFANLKRVNYYDAYCIEMRKKIEIEFINFLEFKQNNKRFEEIMQTISIS